MMQHTTLSDKPFTVLLQEIDHVEMLPVGIDDQDEMICATRESIAVVFNEFLEVKGYDAERVSVIDCFLFLFNDPKFSKWHTLNWWEQRKQVQKLKDHQFYKGRTHDLLATSYLAPYIGYSDDMVAKSTDPKVKHAWMRKRLALKECFWNTIDSVSHAAYYQKKYQELYPALCVFICNIIEKNGRKKELFIGIDNGTGFLYKKKSRESSLIRLFYKTYKFFVRSGVFYIGGLELGLLETDSELSCHGSGAVVFQGWR
jgi:hypothetical protein